MQQPIDLSTQTVVKIVNPTPGSAGYTNGRAAMKHIRRRAAVLTTDGRLYFLTKAQQIELREHEDLEAALARHRKGIISWAGESKERQLVYRPGERRS